jgi:hypothetical protein
MSACAISLVSVLIGLLVKIKDVKLFLKILCYFYAVTRAFSSVGLEHYLDRVGVTGSNPVMPTF